MSKPSSLAVAAAIAALGDPRIREAVATADPERGGSLQERLDANGINGPEREAIEAIWSGRTSRRPRYVPGWRP